MKNYNKLINIVAMTAMLVTGVGGASAYFTATDEKINAIEIAHNQIIPIEEFEEPIIGKKTVKKPQAKNVGNAECYVRAKILLSDSRAGHSIEYYYKELLGFNDADWLKNADGWLYYQLVLDAGEFTTPVFDSIRLLDTVPGEVNELNIDVIFESVQSNGFSNALEAFEAIT